MWLGAALSRSGCISSSAPPMSQCPQSNTGIPSCHPPRVHAHARPALFAPAPNPCPQASVCRGRARGTPAPVHCPGPSARRSLFGNILAHRCISTALVVGCSDINHAVLPLPHINLDQPLGACSSPVAPPTNAWNLPLEDGCNHDA